jgi:hypothetical protein
MRKIFITIAVVLTIVSVSSTTGFAQDNPVTSSIKMEDLFHETSMSDTIAIDNSLTKLESLLKAEPAKSNDYVSDWISRYEYEKNVNSCFEDADRYLRALEKMYLKEGSKEEKNVSCILEKRYHWLLLKAEKNKKDAKRLDDYSKELENIEKSLK